MALRLRKKGLGVRWDVDKQFYDLARHRTEFLLKGHIIGRMRVDTLLANAYLQGVSDASEVIGDRLVDGTPCPACGYSESPEH